MATNKPRFSITVDTATLERVEDYQHNNRIKTQNKAIMELIRKGLEELENEIAEDGVSNAAMQLAEEYDRLDSHGKAAVRGLMDEELNRMETLERLANMDALDLEPEPKIINLFDNPAAAGLALDMTGQSCEPYALKPDDPRGASYAIRVQGNSMEPAFYDGDIAFVNHDAMRDGDIGIFCVDGATVIKQWHQDPYVTYLFSLNRKRADADVVVSRNSGRSIIWQGRVITKRRYPVPGM